MGSDRSPAPARIGDILQSRSEFDHLNGAPMPDMLGEFCIASSEIDMPEAKVKD